jgi:hypothetical protein
MTHREREAEHNRILAELLHVDASKEKQYTDNPRWRMEEKARLLDELDKLEKESK